MFTGPVWSCRLASRRGRSLVSAAGLLIAARSQTLTLQSSPEVHRRLELLSMSTENTCLPAPARTGECSAMLSCLSQGNTYGWAHRRG